MYKIICSQCGTEFESETHTRKYCSDECRKKHDVERKKGYKKSKRMQTFRLTIDEQPIDNPVCLSCYHCGFCGYFRNCDYILDTGMPRGCPGGEECDKYIPKDGKHRKQIIFGRYTK